jgi:hypothetical protein
VFVRHSVALVSHLVEALLCYWIDGSQKSRQMCIYVIFFNEKNKHDNFLL